MKKYTLLLLLALISFSLSAQVGINTDSSDPDPSAMLDVKSTDKGLLIPRMTTTQREAIGNPANGLLVFDTNTGSFWVWTPSQWHELDADGMGKTLIDTDGDTKVEVEHTSDEDIIHLSVKNIEGLQLNENGLFASGTYDFNGIPPVNGAGARMMWVPELAAFRVGEVTGTQWDAFNLGHHSSILGGKNNEIPYSGLFATIAGGTNNIASGNSSFLGSGQSNTASGGGAFLGGGNFNTASGDLSVVSGGSYNTASGYHATLAGGDGNSVSGDHAASIGGYENQSTGDHSFTGGGEGNIAPSYAETVLGSFATTYTPASDSTLVNTDRLFVIGNGTSGANRSNALTLFKNGNVGLGTDNPEGKLHVAGDYFGKGHIWLYANNGVNTSGTAYIQARDKSGSTDLGLQLRTQNSGSIVDALFLSKEGYAGFGETSPVNQVVIRKDANDITGNELVLKNRHATAIGTGSRLVFQGYRDTNPNHEVASIEVEHRPGGLGNTVHGGALVFKTNNGTTPFPQQGAERMRIREDGLVIINDGLYISDGLNMNSNIQLGGHYISNDGDNEGIRIYDDGDVMVGSGTLLDSHFSIQGYNGAAYSFVANGDDGYIDLGVQNNGNIIAELTANTGAFPVNVVLMSGSHLRYAVSSQRYKKNIQSAGLSRDVEKYLSLELKAFQFKEDTSGVYDYGFIAEEVDALGLSRPLSWKKDGKVESIYFDHIAFFNFAALQQHRDRIQALEKRLRQKEEKTGQQALIEDQQKRIAELEAQVAEMETLKAANARMEADIRAIKAALSLPVDPSVSSGN